MENGRTPPAVVLSVTDSREAEAVHRSQNERLARIDRHALKGTRGKCFTTMRKCGVPDVRLLSAARH